MFNRRKKMTEEELKVVHASVAESIGDYENFLLLIERFGAQLQDEFVKGLYYGGATGVVITTAVAVVLYLTVLGGGG